MGTLKFEEATKCLALQSLMMISEFVLDANSNFKTIKKLFLSKLVRNFVFSKIVFSKRNYGSILTVVQTGIFKKVPTPLPLNKFSHNLLCLLEPLGGSRRFTKGL